MVIFNPSHNQPIVIYHNSNIIYVYLPSSFSTTNTFRFNTIELTSQPFYLGPYQDKIVYFDVKNLDKNPGSNTLTIGSTSLTLVNQDNLFFQKAIDDEIDLSFNSIKVSIFQSFITNQTLIQDQSFPYMRNYTDTGLDYNHYLMFTEAIQTPFEFRGINFVNCDFSYSNFNNSLIYDCSFVECNFTNTTFQSGDISGSYFLTCDLTGSDWTLGKVNYTNFVLCNMEQMRFPSTIIHLGHAANYGKIASYPWRLWSGVLRGPQGASIDLLTRVYIPEITQTEADIQSISLVIDVGWYILDQYLNYDSNYILQMNYLGKGIDKVSENETFELGQNYFLDKEHLVDFSGSNLTLSSPLFYSRKDGTNQFYYLSQDEIFALDLSLNSTRALISTEGDRIQRFVDGDYVLNGWSGKEYDLSEGFLEKDFSGNYVVDVSMVNTQTLVEYMITQSDTPLSNTIAKVYYWIDKDTYFYTKTTDISFLYLRKNNTDISFNDVDVSDSLFSHYFYNSLLYISYKIHGYCLRHITIDSNNVISPINLELPPASTVVSTNGTITYSNGTSRGALYGKDGVWNTFIREYTTTSIHNSIMFVHNSMSSSNTISFCLYINNILVQPIIYSNSQSTLTATSDYNFQNNTKYTFKLLYKSSNQGLLSISLSNNGVLTTITSALTWTNSNQLARQVSISPPNYVSIIDFNNILRVWEGSTSKENISCLNLPILSFNNFWHYFSIVHSLSPSNFIMYSTSSGYRIKSITFNEDIVNDLILSYVVSVISIDNPIDRVYFILGINSNNLMLLKFSLVYSIVTDRFSLSQQTLPIPISSTHNPNHLYSIILSVNQNIKILFYQSDISQIKYVEISPNLTFVYPLHTIKTISNVNNLLLYEEGNQTYFRYSISPNLNFTEIIQPQLYTTTYIDATYSILDAQHLIKREKDQFTTLNPIQTIGKTGPLIHDYQKSTYYFDPSNNLKKIDLQNNITTPTLSTNLNLLTLPIDNDENIQITVSNNLFFSTLIYNEILFAETVVRFSDYYAYDRKDGFTTFSLDGNQMLFIDFNTKLLWFFARNIENEFELQYTLLPNTETRKYLNLDDKINSMRVDWRNQWIYFGLGGMNPNSKGKVIICSWTFTQTEYKLVQVVSSLLDPSGFSFGSAIDISVFGDLIAIGEPNAPPSGNFKRGRVNMYRKETNQIVWVNQLRSEEASVGFIVKLSPTENELASFGVTLNPLENMKLILFRSILLPSARSIALPYVVEDFEFFGKEALMTSNEVVEKNSIFHWIQKVNRCFEIVTTRDLTHDSIVKNLSDRFDIYSIRNQYVLMVRKKLDTNNDYQESSIELYHVEDDLEQMGVIDLENKNVKLFGNISSSYDGSTLGYQSYQDGKFNFYFYF